jgi:hypothetical protein
VLLGDEEIGRSEAIVRDLSSGRQSAHSWAELAAAARAVLESVPVEESP